MGRKRTLNRMDFRGDFDEEEPKKEAEEATDEEEKDEEEDGDEEVDEEVDDEVVGEEEEEEVIKPVKKARAKKPAAPKKPRAVKHVRMKVVWIVFDNSSKEVERFPFNQKTEADAYVEQKNTEKKAGHYLQKVKVDFEEK